MWFKRIAYAATSVAILLLTPVAAHADCYSDCGPGMSHDGPVEGLAGACR